MSGHYLPASDALGGWRDDVLSGTPPVLYPVGAGDLARIEIGPGQVTLLGGAPCAGKTALLMQWVIDALRLTPDLKALVCNVEMSPPVLLDRQLARLSGIDLTLIRHRRLGAEHAGRIDQAMSTLEPLLERLAFLESPYDLANAAASADDFGARLIVLDYIQRIAPPGEHGDKRGAVNATMDYLRQFADAGTAVIVVSAVGRGKDKQGRSSYAEGLSLASFRESSELEFGADDAFILVPDLDDHGEPTGTVTLRHLKSRHGECRDLAMTFNGKLQRFDPVSAEARAEKGKLQSDVAALWNRTAPAADGEGVPW